MNITSAQYIDSDGNGTNDHIDIVIDGQKLHVPISEGNRHYDEIMRQVETGELTIADAE